MTFFSRHKRVKYIARVLLFTFIIELIYPYKAFSLTSGPIQPEIQSFQKAGTSDMVNLFTGDMSYNIPLFDIDGYPINLNYNSGSAMEDEASWVGLGWNLNVGAINRQLRGIPDDFAGDTTVVTHYTKPKITVGGKATVKTEVVGKAKITGSFTLGVFSDNYTGIGAEIGVNAGLSFAFAGDNYMTAGMGLGVLSNTASGVDVTPSISMSIAAKSKEDLTLRSGLSASLGYNTRAGLKDLTLGSSFSMTQSFKYYVRDQSGVLRPGQISSSGGVGTNKSFVSYNTEAISPKINTAYETNYDSYSFDIGAAKTVIFTGFGGTGYRRVSKVKNELSYNKSYGYLYAEKGKDQKDAVLDFVREQDNPVIPELPNLAVPIHTPDIFNYSGQSNSGQFRLYRGGTGIYFDKETTDVSNVSSSGFDFGGGFYFHGGITHFELDAKSTTRKWVDNNFYRRVGDFQDRRVDQPYKEHVAFRVVGEMVANDNVVDQKLSGVTPLAVKIDNDKATASFLGDKQTIPLNDSLHKETKTPAVNSVNYLTGSEASKLPGKNKIESHPFYTTSFIPPVDHKIDSNSVSRLKREGGYRKSHHISEISVTNSYGGRSVYGIPVYNVKQQEYTFAIGDKETYKTFDGNQTSFGVNGQRPNHKKGIDHYYHMEEQPSYATSFLLTEVLSADYIDLGKPGISEEDAGSAVKFNYSKVAGNYGWRTPFPSKTTQVGGIGVNGAQNATVNKGLLADPDDDKGLIVYGEKELWYLSSIESKTKIAYFITEDRLDGIGAQYWYGQMNATSVKQKRLVEIRLYSKNDSSKPIKVVKLSHSYTLCPHTPNSIANGTEQNLSSNLTASQLEGGKLTLNKVWFEYGNSNKGKYHPYVFYYNSEGYIGSSENGTLAPQVISYSPMSSDRWGSFKGANVGDFENLKNDEFPYSIQRDLAKMNKNAGLWNISKIDLPSGGSIDVNYEADDYAYVQNKRAMEMVPFEEFDTGLTEDLTGAKGIKLTVDTSGAGSDINTHTRWFKNEYLNGEDNIYVKMFVRMANNQNSGPQDDKDFIATYCKVKSVSLAGNVATIIFEDISEGGIVDNPIRFSAWQNTKQSYPRYAFPGFKNRVGDNSNSSAVAGLVSAVVNASKNLSELKENFYKKAKRKGWNREVVPSKSFVRIVKRDGKKIGGGSRVKKIRIKDNWNVMAGPSAPEGAYGQSYDYTNRINGKVISSGVATYEPSVGNDENPLKLPINYSQKIKGALTNFLSLEIPFGESLYPAASIGYSKITVRDLNSEGDIDIAQRTGYTVSEFYTAKDFPVKVTATPLQKNDRKLKSFFSLVKSESHHENILSQGYYFELNDMHGKSKANFSYNKSNALISSTKYFYKSEEISPGESRLTNSVNLIKDGLVEEGIIGRDLEFYTDFREHEGSNIGRTYNIGVDIFPVLFWPFFALPHGIPRTANNDYKLFRSACAVKVAHYYGVLDRVENMVNGSTIATENIAYDFETGEPIVTRTQNEFKKYIYNVKFPAHWAYNGMSGAYKNSGSLIKGLQKIGDRLNEPFNGFLTGGDELLNLDTGEVFWCIDDGEGNRNIVNRDGYVQSTIDVNHTFKVIRSGYRNHLSELSSTLTCLENPIVDNKLELSDLTGRSLKVLNVNAITFSEDWYTSRQKIGTDTTHVTIPGHSAFATISVENLQTIDTSNGCTHSYSERANNCSILTIGKLLLKTYKSNVFTNENLLPFQGIGNIMIYDSVVRIPDGPDTHYSPRNRRTNQAVTLLDHDKMYDDEYTVLYEHGICYNNNGAETRYTADFNPGYAAENQYYTKVKGLGYVNQTTAPVYSQKPVNPYLAGFKGNWRINSSFQSQLQRENHSILTSKGGNLSDNGYLKDFYFLWTEQNNSNRKWRFNPSDEWKMVSSVTVYDRYGNELENKDGSSNLENIVALNVSPIEDHYPSFGNYSASSFDFNGLLPSAVAPNAMYREIYVNSFEDLIFKSNHYNEKESNAEFKKVNGKLVPEDLSHTHAHTGNYSLNLPTSGIILKTFLHNSPQGFTAFLKLNQKKEYLIADDKYFYGFEPMPKKKYKFSVWVKDTQTTPNRIVTVNLTLNHAPIALNCVAVVENWKKMEGFIDFTNYSSSQEISLRLLPNVNDVKVDDIRLQPADSHMKSYAYDDKNFRLMAELDENAFASFYEYDEQGSLVRVKKETEKGIVTLRESRSSYKKKTL